MKMSKTPTWGTLPLWNFSFYSSEDVVADMEGFINNYINNASLDSSLPFMPAMPGTTWRVGVAPWAKLKPECLNSTLKCEPGEELEILFLVSTLLNATLDFIFSSTQGCGYKTKNDTWLGLIGMLATNEIDIIGNLCTVDEWRMKAKFMKATSAVQRSRQSFLVKIPEATYQFYIWAPFDTQVWYLLSCSFVLYIVLYSILLAYYRNYNIIGAFIWSTIQIMLVTSGMDGEGPRNQRWWIIWLCHVGFFSILYSTYIKVALIKPVTVERPFTDNVDLAHKLLSGDYRYLDYQENVRYPKCYEDSCVLMKKAIEMKGYYYFKQPKTDDGTNQLLNQLLLSPDPLVLTNGRFWLESYLDLFQNGSHLWLIDDELAGEQQSSFFHRSDFKMARLFDRALTLIGDYKINLHTRHLRKTKMVFDGLRVKATMPEKTTMTIGQFAGPIMCLSIGMSVAFVVAIGEVISAKQNNFISKLKRKFRKIRKRFVV